MKKNSMPFRFRFLLAAALCLGQSWAVAQYEYTYINDYQFENADDLMGYTFVPNESQKADEAKPRPIPAGSVRIRMGFGYLTVVTRSDSSNFSAVSVNPTEYGFKLELMNADRPSEQGHLKIFLNDNREVDAMALKTKLQEIETIYYQANINQRVIDRDRKYFTDITTVPLAEIDTLFGLSVRPFFRLGREKKRIYPADSLSFVFSEQEITVGKKTKTERFVTFRYRKVTETDDLVDEQPYAVKNITASTYSLYGDKCRLWQVELKNAPPVLLYCSPKKTLLAIEFDGTVFKLRDQAKY
jgi:hypothetical protein